METSNIESISNFWQGTRQIRRAKIVPVCKRLEVDYAMAMTGFDIHGGRSVPRFEGVVVCEEFAEMVESEWLEEQRYALKIVKWVFPTIVDLCHFMIQRVVGNWDF